MTVRVLFFSLLQDIVGDSEIEVSIPDSGDGTTVTELLTTLYEKFPKLRDWESKLLIAVDCEYADKNSTIKEGQEIALMPPVQGG
ncbi:MoaD/ThiS family protein [bacterium]|nr:MoaD/ThiS family protein [bacterium]